MDNSRWYEKYRPRQFNDISGQAAIMARIQGLLGNGGLCHVLLYGPAGTGKTSTAGIIGRHVLGPSLFKDNFIRLAASDYTTKNAIKNRVIKMFRCMPMGAPYRIIFLDEGDHITQEAQKELLTPLEIYGHVNKVVLVVNSLDKLIEPLQSRFMGFKFDPIPKTAIIKRLREIAHIEGMDFREYQNIITDIADNCNGDLRYAITELQKSSYDDGGNTSLDAALSKAMEIA